MPNTLPILPIIFAQALKTLREACTMPRLVNSDFSDLPVGTGDTVNMTVPTAATVSDVAPSAAPATPPDSSVTKVSIKLDQWKKAGYFLTDKERGEIYQGGIPGLQTEAIRALANNVNGYILGKASKLYGVVGTAGVTPFGGATPSLKDAISARKVLNQQLAPFDDRRLVLSPDAEAAALLLLTNAQLVGDGKNLIAGSIGRTLGMDWFMDQQVGQTISTPFTAGAVTVNGVNAVGAGSTDLGRNGTVSLAKITNAGALKAGDIISIANDPQTYVVTADTALIVGNSSVPISPALKKATVGAEVVTLTASSTNSLAFHRDCFAFASRRLTSEISNNQLSIADPVSRVVFRVELIRQNKQDYVEFDILFGAECVRPELGVRILG